MSGILTADEIAFLEKMRMKNEKHRLSQAKYREKNKDKVDDYNKKYNQDLRQKQQEINKKLLKADEPLKTINIEKIVEVPKIDKRTRRGKKQTTTIEIKPSYTTRNEPLEYSTIEDYIRKANIINKLFNKQNLPQDVKAEIRKLLNDNPNIDENLILNEMTYIKNDVEPTINFLRSHYQNDNSFKSYINILAVITSHFKTINTKIYQTLTKIGKSVNTSVQDKREDNILNDEDEGKIINLDKNEILKNMDKFENVEDMLLYGLYTLFPARRLDYRNMKITTETNADKLNEINYLIIAKNKKFVFNDYKTYKIYGKQVFDIPNDLDTIINKYINIKGLKSGDFLFPLNRNNQEITSQPNFTKKIASVFKKVYGIPISVRFLRMSWASSLYNMNRSMKEIKNITYTMSHSPEESRLYNKIFITNEKK